jgi:hypothetical protein
MPKSESVLKVFINEAFGSIMPLNVWWPLSGRRMMLVIGPPRPSDSSIMADGCNAADDQPSGLVEG